MESKTTTTTTASPTTDGKFRVAIIGGGLGGLSLAQVLRTNPRLRVTVYERQADCTDRLAGYRIQMERAALDYLKALVAPALVDAVERSVAPQPPAGQHLGFMRAADKRLLMTWYPAELRRMVSVNRWVLRAALLHEQEEFLQVGKKLVRYEVDGSEVVLYFEDGSSDMCDLLVGADGVWSKVRSQLLPHIRVKNSDIGVTYFKVPWLPENEKLVPFGTGVAAFCEKNQVITTHGWVNPEARYTENSTTEHIGQEQSFIMAGFGSELRHYHNKSKNPEQFTSEELRDEVRTRLHGYKKVDPLFVEMADKVVLDSAYSNILKLVEQPKPWDNPCVTLLGDATMNMSPYTGKGASLAIADAMELAGVLKDGRFYTDKAVRRKLMKGYVTDMIKRRVKQRKGGVFIQKCVFFGRDRFRVVCRDALFCTVDAAGHVVDKLQGIVGEKVALTDYNINYDKREKKPRSTLS
ncbi:hypothetical protein DL769_008846 [Monosporascus sp. CRB-8-3]|nr:hypothetical protein DL769_008846 [Monosporascus sp. CRB-8-3]